MYEVVHVGVKPDDDYPINDWGMPELASKGAACFDLRALLGEHEERVVYTSDTFRTGLHFEIPPGFVMLIFGRSGHGFKNQVRLANCVGVIDSDYRGEVLVKLLRDIPNDGAGSHFTYTVPEPLRIRRGDRIAQAMIVKLPVVELALKSELSPTERGDNGFGSTG